MVFKSMFTSDRVESSYQYFIKVNRLLKSQNASNVDLYLSSVSYADQPGFSFEILANESPDLALIDGGDRSLLLVYNK